MFMSGAKSLIVRQGCGASGNVSLDGIRWKKSKDVRRGFGAARKERGSRTTRKRHLHRKPSVLMASGVSENARWDFRTTKLFPTALLHSGAETSTAKALARDQYMRTCLIQRKTYALVTRKKRKSLLIAHGRINQIKPKWIKIVRQAFGAKEELKESNNLLAVSRDFLRLYLRKDNNSSLRPWVRHEAVLRNV